MNSGKKDLAERLLRGAISQKWNSDNETDLKM